jgi:hypothetical protein
MPRTVAVAERAAATRRLKSPSIVDSGASRLPRAAGRAQRWQQRRARWSSSRSQPVPANKNENDHEGAVSLETFDVI